MIEGSRPQGSICTKFVQVFQNERHILKAKLCLHHSIDLKIWTPLNELYYSVQGIIYPATCYSEWSNCYTSAKSCSNFFYQGTIVLCKGTLQGLQKGYTKLTH